MGISLTSVHIYGGQPYAHNYFSFLSLSPNWQTCVNDLSDKDPDYSYKLAKMVSEEVDAPVLHFGVFDSEMIWLEFFHQGKMVARYSDDELVSNKKIYDIPAIVGCDDGNKKRLSAILACVDVEEKIAMLEEFFGVCLLYDPQMQASSDAFFRQRDDAVYRAYQEKEKKLTGKAAQITANVIKEYPGKLFWDGFGSRGTKKPHFFLQGYGSFEETYGALAPVQFTGPELQPADPAEFRSGRIPNCDADPRFGMEYGAVCKVSFSAACPEAYCGRTMVLPSGFYPLEFLPTGELLLQGRNKIYIADATFQIVAKLSVKGEVADVLGNYILTTTGDSFCGYCYEPRAKIYIYKVNGHR